MQGEATTDRLATNAEDGEHRDTLIGHVGIAIYAAKKAGRDNHQRHVPSLDGKPSSIHQGA
jgi:hypothetical protein